MSDENKAAATEDVNASPFAQFAEQNGDYYNDTFLSIQKAKLNKLHINVSALLGSFVWAAMRSNWLLFWIGLFIDLLALVNFTLVYKYNKAAVTFSNKQFLVDRYESWASSYLIGGIVILVLGRLLFGWLADRVYFKQYNRWRVDHSQPSGITAQRLVLAAVIVALIAPLTLYRSSQIAPEQRACIKLDRKAQKGESVPFKDRFDCFVIGEFPTLIWMDRPDEISYPRNDDGSRYVKRTPAREDLPSVNLNTYAAQTIDDGIGYLTAFHGVLFDSITKFLRTILSAITALFVGTPWIIVMGLMITAAYYLAGKPLWTPCRSFLRHRFCAWWSGCLWVFGWVNRNVVKPLLRPY